MKQNKKATIGGIDVELSNIGPKGDGDMLFKTAFNDRNDLEWWGIKSKLRGASQIEWFGTGGKEEYHSCDAAIVRPMLRNGSGVIVWLEAHGHVLTEGVFITVSRANVFDASGKLIETEPGRPEKTAVYYEGQLAGFMAHPEVAASFDGAFAELRAAAK